jgi:hypothetical protein
MKYTSIDRIFSFHEKGTEQSDSNEEIAEQA